MPLAFILEELACTVECNAGVIIKGVIEVYVLTGTRTEYVN
jgi:hypothetical protein